MGRGVFLGFSPQKEMMKFSILLPTRNNVSGLVKMFKSLEDTISDINKLEVLLAVDNDDEQYQEISGIETKINYQIYRRDKTTNFSNDYYNWLASKSGGDALQAFNDDAYYQTKDWDLIIERKVSGFDLWFADIHTTTRFLYPDFPMVSRKSFEVLGFLLHPQVRIYPADMKIFELYNKAGLVIDCTDVKIFHERLMNGQTHEGWGDVCLEDDKVVKNMNLDNDVRKLREYGINS